MDAWHFLLKDRHTSYEPRVLVTEGQTLKHDGPLELCKSGLHASVRAIDALKYAPGPIVCRVRLGGEIKGGGDKVVARERTVLWMYDATPVLHEMACISATTALLIADAQDERCWQAIEAKRAWLRGEIDDAQLAAARDAAADAADAANVAAADATDAADAADAAATAARDEQNTVLEALLDEGRP